MHWKFLIVAILFTLQFGVCNSPSDEEVAKKAGPTPVAQLESPANKQGPIGSWKIEKILQVTPAVGSISFGTNGIGFIGGTDQHFWISHDSGHSWNDNRIAYGGATRRENDSTEDGWYDLVKSLITTTGSIYAIGHLEEVGSVILTSNDDAKTWRGSSYLHSALNDIDSAEDNVWVVGAIGKTGVVLKLNSERKWQIIWKAKYSYYLEGVDFINANLGWFVGVNGLVLKSLDGGRSLKSQVSGTRYNLTSVSFADSENGFIVGDRGTIRTTNNGGVTWSESKSGTQADLTKVVAISSREACVVGRNGIVLRTIDAGKNWYRYPLGTDADVYALTLNGNDCWVAASDGNVFRLPAP